MLKMGFADSRFGRGVGGKGVEEEVGADAGITPGEGRHEVVSCRMIQKAIRIRLIVDFHWTQYGR